MRACSSVIIARSLALALGLLVAGCASTRSTIETRRQERLAAYQAFSEEDRTAVDRGQLRVGMSEDAVYISWGKPAQVVESADASGQTITWLYEGQTSDDLLRWRQYPVPRPDGTVYFDRNLERDIYVRNYVAAELVFRGGRLQSWRTMPKPPSSTLFGAPGPF